VRVTVPPDIEAQILRAHDNEGWPIGTIATQLGVHHDVVARVLDKAGVPTPKVVRPCKLDAFVPFIKEILKQFPSLRATRVRDMCMKRGATGSESTFRRLVRRLRPRSAEAYLRLRTLPGEQAQVDWGHFGKLTIGRAVRALVAFVIVLSFSRRIFLRFYVGQQTENFLSGHAAAFAKWGGVPHVILYDNLKSAVLERVGHSVRFNPLLLAFAMHHRFEPRPVAVARGNEKGRVERSIRYVRESFFAGLVFDGLDDLNRKAEEWCEGPAASRLWVEDKSLTVAQAFEQERSHLLPLPANGFPIDERREVSIGKTPYARFDGNDYSVPHHLVQRILTVLASPSRVRILDGSAVVADHARSYSRGDQVEDQRHIEALVLAKRHSHKHRGFDRLYRAAPSSEKLIECLAERGENLGSATTQLLQMLDEFGGGDLEAAIVDALSKGAPHPHAVRHILEQQRRKAGEKPRTPVRLPDDPQLDVAIEPHSLASYDEIGQPAKKEQEGGDAR